MYQNYFKTAWRTLWRNKLYTSLNIAGLTFGITCFLLIGLYLFDELTFDQMHSKAERIYRVVEHKKTKNEDLNIAGASHSLAIESKKNIAEIENTTRFVRTGRANISTEENQIKFHEDISVCDENLLDVFDFELSAGDRKTALKAPNSIIVTEDLAQRLFGYTQVLGKVIKLAIIEKPLHVTAVLKNHPRNSSFNFSMMVSESTFGSEDSNDPDWSSNGYSIYTLLREGADPNKAAQKMTQLVLANYRPEPGTKIDYSLQALKDMHLHSADIVDGARNTNIASMVQGSMLYIRIFSLIALFVLLIACINYMNLTTARASNRAKEIGVRKSIGAFRQHLVNQFMLESFIITLIAFVLAILLVNLLLPAFNQFTVKDLSLGFATDYRIWLSLFVALVLTSLLSGSYPALLLSGFKTLLLLKGIKTSNKSGLSLRKGLVVFQFTISVVMIVATIVLFLQVRFINNKNLGFNQDQLLVVDINSGIVRREAKTIKTEFAKIAGVKDVSVTSRVPGEWKTLPTVQIKTAESAEDPKVAYLIGVDEDFTPTFGVELTKGRPFQSIADSSSIILNETAAQQLGIQEASDQLVEIPTVSFEGAFFPLNEQTNEPFRARVIGIVKDFNFQSLRQKIEPMVLVYTKNPVHSIDYFTAKIEGGDAQVVLKKMEAILAKIDADHFFEYHFLDGQLALFYIQDKIRETLLMWIAIATLFIACFGLFGLATYAAEQRVKEIGVRKVLGASVVQLTSLLSKDFLKLVLIANGIAFPLAWWATDRWLQEFAYHVEVKWWVFAVAGIAALGIALMTVAYQAVSAALKNPVLSLKSE